MHISPKIFRLLEIIIEKVKDSHHTIATAESCTGGLLAVFLTELNKSSEFYLGGASVYSNYAKEKILNIPASLINKNGAVSEAVAKAMAENVKNLLKAGTGISLTGIAGPTGGTHDKPVGTVWLGLSNKTKTYAKPLALKGNRHEIRIAAARIALEELLKSL